MHTTKAQAATGAARAALSHAADAAGDRLATVPAQARDLYADRVAPSVGAARAKLGPVVSDAVGTANARVGPVVSDAYGRARGAVGPAVGDARDRVGDALTTTVVPALHDAGQRVAPVLHSAGERLAPALAGAGASARELAEDLAHRAEPLAAEASRRGGNAVAALRGAPVAPRRRRRRWLGGLALVTAVGGAAFAAVRALRGPGQDPWIEADDLDGPVTPASTPPTTAPADAGQHAPATGTVQVSTVEESDVPVSGVGDVPPAAEQS